MIVAEHGLADKDLEVIHSQSAPLFVAEKFNLMLCCKKIKY